MLAMVYTTLSMLSKLNAIFIHCNCYHRHTPSTPGQPDIILGFTSN